MLKRESNFIDKDNVVCSGSTDPIQPTGNRSPLILTHHLENSNDETLLTDKKVVGVLSFNASMDYWAEANRRGQLSMRIIFDRLKYRNNHNPIDKRGRIAKNPFNDSKLNQEFFDAKKKMVWCDKTGGFIKKRELKNIAKDINVSFHTLRSYMPKMVKAGLLIKTITGWKMINMSMAAEQLGVKLNKLHIRVGSKSKQEFKIELDYLNLKTVERKRDKVLQEKQINVPVTISCNTLAKRMGYKSAMTGSRHEKLLEKFKKVIISRYDLVRGALKKGAEINSFFIWSDYSYSRPCNEINILKPC